MLSICVLAVYPYLLSVLFNFYDMILCECMIFGGLIYTIICVKSVVVRKLQVAILARSPREMSQTDRIV